MTVFSTPTRAAVATLMMLGCCAARAGEPAADVGDESKRWSFGGYGTLGVAHSSDDQSDFTANVLNPGNAGHSRDWTASVDSRVGMQLGLNLDSDWSAVLQVVSERTLHDGGYRPVVEWANVQYQVSHDLNLRLGRIALPMFLVGDYRKAGYALPWVRPPVELYSAIPLSNSDGVDATYRWCVGSINNETQFFVGHTDLALGNSARAQARQLIGLSNTSTSGALTVRTSLLTAQLSVDVAHALFDGFRQFGSQGAVLVARYDLSAKRSEVATVGFNYDPGNWFLMGELGRMNTDSYLGDKTAAYLSAGYRYRDLTPYAVVSASRANTETQSAGLDLSGLPPPVAAAGAQLNAGLNQLLAAIPRQHTISAGVRWDLYRNHALKFQVDRIMTQQGSTGTFINVQPGFRSGQAVVVVSAALDFVF